MIHIDYIRLSSCISQPGKKKRKKKDLAVVVWEHVNQQSIKPVMPHPASGSSSPTLINFISVTIKGFSNLPWGAVSAVFQRPFLLTTNHSGCKKIIITTDKYIIIVYPYIIQQ